MSEVSFDPSLEMTSTKEVRLDVIRESNTATSSSRGSSNSSLSEHVLMPGSMPSSFQVETPRKVPKRSKKRSIHFSQLEKAKKKHSYAFNKVSWILLAFNILQIVAIVFVVVRYSKDENELKNAVCVGKEGRTSGSPDDPFDSLDDKGTFMLSTISQYLLDLAVGGKNFTQDFGKDRVGQPMQTKITPPWDLGYLQDDEVEAYFPALAPWKEPDTLMADRGTNQAIAVYERKVNMTFTMNTVCYFTNFALGTFVAAAQANDGAAAEVLDPVALGTVQHFEQEGFCQSKVADNGGSELAHTLAPFVQETIEKTAGHPCTSVEEFRVKVVQELLGIIEARARMTFSGSRQAEIEAYASSYFDPQAEAYIRDATGEYRLYQGRSDVVRAMFTRQSFVALQHRVLAQNFDVSVVSEFVINGPNQRRDWFDTAFFHFTGQDASAGPPVITKVYFSFHN